MIQVMGATLLAFSCQHVARALNMEFIDFCDWKPCTMVRWTELGREEERMQSFGEETRREENTRNSYMWRG
jgi:hypothetical protein